ncbi:MAG TPA: chemotaxis protein CheD [Candidatus Polarisedimenticolia bacterium]|nr:chemotaxis protein CheD [Candidatus Polarisedimenticolia bacterium]
MTPAPETVHIGELLVRSADEAPGGLLVPGLGSCVAVFLHDAPRRLGGLAHILLPEPMPHSPLLDPGRFAPTAVAALVDRLMQRGARRELLVAKVAGGATMFARVNGVRDSMGDRNVRAAMEALAREAIPVAAMDVGGSSGRTVRASLADGRVRINTLRGRPREI